MKKRNEMKLKILKLLLQLNDASKIRILNTIKIAILILTLILTALVYIIASQI